MPGYVRMDCVGRPLANMRYESKSMLRSIIQHLTLRYGTENTITILPDEQTEAQTAAQCEALGCGISYHRVFGLDVAVGSGDHIVSLKKVV